MSAYYNEFDPYTAQWLRNLITAGHIADGEVDERSIADVHADDLKGFTQCHFFAGIGGWSLAARLAGWPDERPLWTGSCPCQPFSVANLTDAKNKGSADPRHLWPEFYRLIRIVQPSAIFGEQVKDAIAWGWLDEVFGDLESAGYACGATIVPASAVEADHERQRLFWVADCSGAGWKRYKQIECSSVGESSSLSINSSPFVDARRAMAGNYSHLLFDDGVSVGVERAATKGYGNAIVPQLAAEIIRSYQEARQ